MKKPLKIFGLIFLLVFACLSGCSDDKESSDDNTNDTGLASDDKSNDILDTDEELDKIVTISYSDLWDDVKIFDDGKHTLQSYKGGDTIYIEDRIIDITYLDNILYNQNNYTDVTVISFNGTGFGNYELWPLYLRGNHVSEYTENEIQIIPVNVVQFMDDDRKIIWIEPWLDLYMSVSGMIGGK
jgi:hypothetical protein